MMRNENMIYTCTYKSMLGDILLASDETGLTGLWFEDRNILLIHFLRNIFHRKLKFWQRQKNGWIYILQEKNRNLLLRFIQTAQHSDRQCGRSCYRYLMVRQSHTEKSPDNWLKCRMCPICLRRQ